MLVHGSTCIMSLCLSMVLQEGDTIKMASVSMVNSRQHHDMIERLLTMVLKRHDTLGSVSTIFYKDDNFCDFMFTFLHTRFLLPVGANSFLFE